MNLTRASLALGCLLAAFVCFVVAFLLAIHVFTGGNLPAWVTGGLALFTAAHLP